MDNTQVLQVTDNVSWVGVMDPNLVSFDIVMETKFGIDFPD